MKLLMELFNIIMLGAIIGSFIANIVNIYMGRVTIESVFILVSLLTITTLKGYIDNV
jgi:hypothetical protein